MTNKCVEKKTADLQSDRKDKKRRREAEACDGSDGESSLDRLASLPNYGTKDYWEDRYRNGVDGDGGGSPEAGHCWYFTYRELRSLVLPLLLGSESHELCQNDLETDDDVEEWVVEGEEYDGQDEWVEAEAETPEAEPSSEPNNQADSGKVAKQDDTVHADEGVEDEGKGDEREEEDEEEEELNLDSAQYSIPKKVLEIGCGDVPLGSGLVDDLISMQSKSSKLAKSVVKEVTCIDYSETVVQNLIREQKGGGGSKCKKSSNTLEVKYEILDARKLPYDANSYDLIFEKGTMDAMLSDASEGVENCIQIVCEMARVCSLGGSIMIVSHLNANDPKGMGWLRDVVIRGLEREFQLRNDAKMPSGDDDAKEYVWFISVNGGEGDVVDDEAEELGFRSTYGPAVYILTKKTVTRSLALEMYGKPRGGGTNDCKDLLELPPVKIEFVTH